MRYRSAPGFRRLSWRIESWRRALAKSPRSASAFDAIVIGGDLLDLGADLDFDVQMLVVEKYLRRLRQRTQIVISSGNHDGDSRNEVDESVARWIRESKTDGLFVDGDQGNWSGAFVTICPWWDGPVTRAELEAQLIRDSQSARGR